MEKGPLQLWEQLLYHSESLRGKVYAELLPLHLMLGLKPL